MQCRYDDAAGRDQPLYPLQEHPSYGQAMITRRVVETHVYAHEKTSAFVGGSE